MKKVIYVFLGLFILVLLIVGAAPTIFSTDWGNRQLLALINDKIPGRLHAKRISLSWFGGQSVEEVSLIDPQGNQVLTVASIQTGASLFPLLLHRTPSGSISLNGLNALLARTYSGASNLEEALGWKGFALEIPEVKPLKVSNVAAELSPTSIKASGFTQDGANQGSFNIAFSLEPQGRRWSIDVKQFPVQLLDAAVSTQNPGLSGVLVAALGDSLDVTMDQAAVGTTTSMRLTARAPYCRATLEAALEEGKLTLVSPAEASFRVTQAVFSALSAAFPELQRWRLENPVDFGISLENLTVPASLIGGTKGRSPKDHLALRASLTLPTASLSKASNPRENLRVQNLALQVNTFPEAQWIDCGLRGELVFDAQPLSLSLDGKIAKSTEPEMLLANFLQPEELTIALENVPSKMFDEEFDLNHFLENSFGERLSFRFASSSKDPHTLQMGIVSDRVDIPQILLQLDKGLVFDEHMMACDYEGTLSADSVTFRNSLGVSSIRSLHVPWKLRNGFRRFEATFTALTSASVKEPHAKIEGHVDVNNIDQLERSTLRVSCNGHQVPAGFLQMMTGIQAFAPVFGNVLDIHVGANLTNLNGTLMASIEGENGHLVFKGDASNGVLTLTEPLTLETTGSERLGQEFLGQYAPIFKDMLGADQPIKVIVAKDNFSIPLHTFRMEGINIGSASLDMGKLHFKNSKEMKKLLNGFISTEAPQVTIWTTPVYLNVTKGLVTLYRTDFLLMEQFPMAVWGNVDLPKDSVNMILGIKGEALSRALNLSNVDKETMVQVPIKGSLSNAKVETTKAMTRVWSLVAQNQGGPHGLVLGTVLDIASGKEGKVPPQTTNPLPWDKGTTHSPSQEIADEPSRQTPQFPDNPVKDIKKGAKKLLKGLLR